MQISIINIGNSKGIRLSKTILDKYNITDKVELILHHPDKMLLVGDDPFSWQEFLRLAPGDLVG